MSSTSRFHRLSSSTSGADARSAFVTLVGDEPTVDAPTVGDESAVTLLAGTTPDTGSEYQAARLVFRLGPMLGMIVYADLRNETPDLAVLDTVAQGVAGRGTVVADRQSVPLGAMTVQGQVKDWFVATFTMCAPAS